MALISNHLATPHWYPTVVPWSKGTFSQEQKNCLKFVFYKRNPWQKLPADRTSSARWSCSPACRTPWGSRGSRRRRSPPPPAAPRASWTACRAAQSSPGIEPAPRKDGSRNRSPSRRTPARRWHWVVCLKTAGASPYLSNSPPSRRRGWGPWRRVGQRRVPPERLGTRRPFPSWFRSLPACARSFWQRSAE